MDLYRYFHPHHNPRLRNRSLRLQELGELEQAARELLQAVKRAEVRTRNSPAPHLRKEQFPAILSSLNFLVESLAALTRAHPGDEPEDMWALLAERQEAPGWENWSRLLGERLQLLNLHEDYPPVRKEGNSK